MNEDDILCNSNSIIIFSLCNDGYDDTLSGEAWFDLLSNLPGCVYLATSPNAKPYELAPTMTNVSRVIRHLVFGKDDDVNDRGINHENDDVSSSRMLMRPYHGFFAVRG